MVRARRRRPTPASMARATSLAPALAVARYSSPPPRVAAFRRSPREIVGSEQLGDRHPGRARDPVHDAAVGPRATGCPPATDGRRCRPNAVRYHAVDDLAHGTRDATATPGPSEQLRHAVLESAIRPWIALTTQTLSRMVREVIAENGDERFGIDTSVHGISKISINVKDVDVELAE